MNPYEVCPRYETKSFSLRPVRLSDARALLRCYSDRDAVKKMNADNCTSDFYDTSPEEMSACIEGWLRAYEKREFARLTILPKGCEDGVGTLEIFGGRIGVLRLDLASDYETEKYVSELVRLAVLELIEDFRVGSLKIKTSNTPERVPVLEEHGFVPDTEFLPESRYYKRFDKKYFSAEKGVAYCGLACCVCSENETCPGCRNEGCTHQERCKAFQCCKGGGRKGCWECGDFPCSTPMLQKLRVRTFAAFIGEHGEGRLLQALQANEKRGILYHYPGKLVGDYDLLESKEEILVLLERGMQEKSL